jgi:hypothetical protein
MNCWQKFPNSQRIFKPINTANFLDENPMTIPSESNPAIDKNIEGIC